MNCLKLHALKAELHDLESRRIEDIKENVSKLSTPKNSLHFITKFTLHHYHLVTSHHFVVI